MDYLKVQYQVNTKIPSPLQVYNNIGFTGFYKGSSSIYALVGAITAVEFYCFEGICNFLSQRGWVEPNGERNTENLMLSGFLTGGVAAFIYTPIEFSKIRCQVSTTSKQGSISRIIQILKQEKLRGVGKLYTGLGVTVTK